MVDKGGGTVQNTLEGGGTEKRGGETKILKRGGGDGSRGGCLKKGGGLEPLYEQCINIISLEIDTYIYLFR